jgi:hypothetical protein
VKLVTILLSIAGILVCGPVSLAADEAAILRDVESAFNRAVSRFQYGQAWTLWESGDQRSREHWTQAEFQQRMQNRSSQIAPGHPVEILEIRIASPTVAVVQVRCVLASQRPPRLFTTEHPFAFIHEDGEWRPVLANFLGLSAH